MKRIFLILLAVLMSFAALPQVSFADSPITSTEFYSTYLDIEIVEKAAQLQYVDEEIAQYLSNQSNPIDVKAAVINALGWNYDGKDMANEFTEIVFKKSVNELDLDSLSGSDLFCIGYLTCMSDYFNPEKALPILEKASQKINNSQTVSVITALVKAQIYLSSNWYKLWKVYESVINDEGLKNDMRPEALDIINDYMYLYSDCIGIEPSVITLKTGETATALINGGTGDFKVLQAKVMTENEFVIYGGAQIPEGVYYSTDVKADISIQGNILTVKGINPGVILLTIQDENQETVSTPVVICPVGTEIKGTSTPTSTPSYTPTPEATPTAEPYKADSTENNQKTAGNKITVNGKQLILDVPPVMENNRMLVPVRAIFEALNGKIEWNAKTKTVLGQKGDVVVELQIGNVKAKVNGEVVTLDAPARIINNRTLVPVRFISESLGAKVNWDAKTKTAEITTQIS
jgi:hypothetical protein